MHREKNGKLFPRRANLDIYVYKVLKELWTGTYAGYKYQTPVHFMPVTIGKLMLNVSFRKYSEENEQYFGYHSFTSKRKAIKFITDRPTETLVLFEAVIPRGSLYYEGDDVILSNQLKVLKKI